uniref:SET domain-containing protein n=1 Tax=viral metagenome TaxID=1070528 RepID=A0A6C0BNI0_9ZZZZ
MPKKKKKSANKIILLYPTPVTGTCYYTWPKLEVKEFPGQGYGVYATERLSAGIAVPILGKVLTKFELDTKLGTAQASHIWEIRSLKPGWPYTTYIDGNPRYKPYKRVGSGGLAIAMMVNEPSRTKPNCIFKRDCLITADTIKAGEQLTAFYDNPRDPNYEATRRLKNYSIAKNRYYKAQDDLKYRQLDKRDFEYNFAKKRDDLMRMFSAHIMALPYLCQALAIKRKQSRKKQKIEKARWEWAVKMAQNMNEWARANAAREEGSCPLMPKTYGGNNRPN